MIQISQELCDFFENHGFFEIDEDSRFERMIYLQDEFCERFNLKKEIFTYDYQTFLYTELEVYASVIYIQQLHDLIVAEWNTLRNIERVRCQDEFFTG